MVGRDSQLFSHRRAGGGGEIARRVDFAAHWLGAAVEAANDGGAPDSDQEQTADRLAGLIDVIDALSHSPSEPEVMALVMDAIALWYDVDVRVYRQELPNAFVLHACLPAVDADRVARRLEAESIVPGHRPFRVDETTPAASGWDGDAAVFVPLSVEDSIDWLLTVSASADPTFGATVELLSHVVSVRLTQLSRDAADQLRARLRRLLTFGDAPFDVTARLALELITRDIGALSARLASYSGPHSPATLVVGWAMPEDEAPGFVEAHTISTTSHAITIGMAAGAGTTAVLDLRAPHTVLSAASARLAHCASEMLGVWLSGALVAPREIRVPDASEHAIELIGRLAGHVDRSGRLEPGGALAVVLPDVEELTGVQLDEVMQVVQEQVRSSDLVGVVGSGAGVLIPGAGPAAASAVVNRLLRAAGGARRLPIKVGVTTFPPLSASPGSLVARALANARRELAS